MTLGEFLKEKRDKRELTINELSKLTNISTAQISRLENNEQTPKLTTIIDLAKTLNFSLNELAQKVGYNDIIENLADIKSIVKTKGGKYLAIQQDGTHKEISEEEAKATGLPFKEFVGSEENVKAKCQYVLEEEQVEQIAEKAVEKVLSEQITPLSKTLEHLNNIVEFNKKTIQIAEFIKKHNLEEEKLDTIIEKFNEYNKDPFTILPPGAMLMKPSSAKLPLVIGAKCGDVSTIALETYEKVSVPESWQQKGDYVLEVNGDSMKEYGIWDGYWVLIRKQKTCESGNIALVCNYDDFEAPRLILKKAKNIDKIGMIFINGKNEIVPLGEKYSVEGIALSWMKPL